MTRNQNKKTQERGEATDFSVHYVFIKYLRQYMNTTTIHMPQNNHKKNTKSDNEGSD